MLLVIPGAGAGASRAGVSGLIPVAGVLGRLAGDAVRQRFFPPASAYRLWLPLRAVVDSLALAGDRWRHRRGCCRSWRWRRGGASCCGRWTGLAYAVAPSSERSSRLRRRRQIPPALARSAARRRGLLYFDAERRWLSARRLS